MTRKQWFAMLMAGLMAGLALILTAAPTLADASIIRVDADATGPTHDGLSWTTAYTNVQDALTWTNAHTTTLYEIWVAEGVYYPDEGSGGVNDAVTETFRIDWNNVQLYGGFGGYGISETQRTQRDWNAHPTLLSGDIDANDTNTDGNSIAETWNDMVGSNAYHVLYLDGVTNQPITAVTTLDGLIITAGQANDAGGGLYCAGNGSGKACSPTLTNVTFCGNKATYYGGGMFNDGSYGGASSPTLTNVTFSGNKATYNGGGMFNFGYNGGASSPTLTNVTFSGNSADRGGGMFNDGFRFGASSPTLTNVTFSGNSASQGGGMYNDGGNSGASSPTLTNVTFSGNSADWGGGMVNNGYGGASSPTLTNVTFSGNSASYWGGGMYNAGGNSGVSSPTLTNVTFSGNWAGNGGGMYNDGYIGGASSPTLTNVTFSSNKASYGGGGMYNFGYGSGTSSPTLTSVTFSGNSADWGGGGMLNNGYGGAASSPTLVNTILWDNTASDGPQILNVNAAPILSYSDVQGGCPAGATCGSGMIYADPLFVAPITATAAPTTTGNYRLAFGSPAINAGNTLSVTVATDLDGNPRIWGGVVDMGAYETWYYYYSVYLPVVRR